MGSALSLERGKGGFGNPEPGFGSGNPVLNMSRLGGNNVVAQLVADILLQSTEVLSISRLVDSNPVAQSVVEIPPQSAEVREKCSNDGHVSQVVRDTEEGIGIAPISIVVTIYHPLHHEPRPSVKPEPDAPL